MKTIDPAAAAVIVANKANVLRAYSEAFAMDIAIAPVLIMCDRPGLGVANLSKGIAASMTLAPDAVAHILCGNLDEMDVKSYPVLRGGDIEQCEPRIVSIVRSVANPLGSVVILADAESAPTSMLVAALGQIADAAKEPVVVAIVAQGGIDTERTMLAAIKEGLGLHAAHVPTARVAGPEGTIPSQPILLFGQMSQESSKCGEQYMEISVAEPFDHEIRFTVRAKDDQDDDALIEALYSNMDPRDVVAVRLEVEDGRLVCTSDDVTAA